MKRMAVSPWKEAGRGKERRGGRWARLPLRQGKGGDREGKGRLMGKKHFGEEKGRGWLGGTHWRREKVGDGEETLKGKKG